MVEVQWQGVWSVKPALNRWLKSQVAKAAENYRKRLRASLVPGTYTSVVLKHGEVTIISPQDYDLYALGTWYAIKPSDGHNTYVKVGTARLHRLVLGLSDESYLVADHINGDGLDNRRENLRAVASAQNYENTMWPDSLRLELKAMGIAPTDFKRADRGRLWHFTSGGPVAGPRPR